MLDIKIGMELVALAVSAAQIRLSKMRKINDDTENLPGNDISSSFTNHVDPFESVVTPEVEKAIKELYDNNPQLKQEAIEDIKAGNLKRQQEHNINNAWINTYTGRKFHPLNPNISDVCIEDIAHALSMQCRFTGHCSEFYSVAQHSVLVSYLCDTEDQLHGLLHDASEAYICDLSSPLKRSGAFENYKMYEKKIQDAVFSKYGLSIVEPASVKKADMLIFATEARWLLKDIHPKWKIDVKSLPMKIEPLNPKEAKQLFLDRFNELAPTGFVKYGEDEYDMVGIEDFIDEVDSAFPEDDSITITGDNIVITSKKNIDFGEKVFLHDRPVKKDFSGSI
jgi:uncharacterized protein